MMEYNDYELVYYAQENNEIASKILYDKYYKILYNKAFQTYKSLKNSGLDFNDILLEVRLIFEKAIVNFNQDGTSSFATFFNVCVDRQLATLVTSYTRGKYVILNNAISIDELTDGNINSYFIDNITPEFVLFDEYNGFNLYNKIKSKLTFFEEIIFELKLLGIEYKEMVNFLGIESKEIYNAVSRIKFKFNLIK